MAKWYAVMADREDTDWGFGSFDLEQAKRLLKKSEYEEGYIAVIENDVCVDELTQEELFNEEEMKKLGVITVEEFKKAVEEFGFNSPVVTAIWNTMEQNPNNAEEFETIYALNATGRFATYRNTDTGETFTYDELAELWRQFGHEMNYKCFEDFIEYAVEKVKG